MATGLHIDSKNNHHVGRWLALLVFILITAAVGWYGFRWYTTGEGPPIPMPLVKADTRISETPISHNDIADYKVPASNPRYISIPAINVGKTRIYPIGTTKDGQLDTPSNIGDTAWYTQSSAPGSGGVVLLDGHNGGTNKDGVFAKLSTLAVNDIITVERGDGKTFTYKVVENKIMSLDEANRTGMKNMMLPVVDGKESLSLVTCAGNWVPRDKVFDKRVMLRAVIVDS